MEELLSTIQAPVYVVYFTQAQALEQAQALMSVQRLHEGARRSRSPQLIGDFRFAAGFGKTLSRLVRHGIGVHHAGMLPKYRRLVETLAQAGLLKVICGTDTLGVGINVPIRTVLFTSLSKYDGKKTRLLQAREFHQIAGRAGRAGFDTSARVVVQAPEHVIENEKALAKAGDDPEGAPQGASRRSRPEGFIGYGLPTFERLRDSEPEPLTSSFTVTHAMILNVIDRPGNAYLALKHLLRDNHEPRDRQRKHVHRAIEIYRALLAGGVVERLDEPDEDGRIVRVTVDLQYDFALNQPLSPFALAAIELLSTDAPDSAPAAATESIGAARAGLGIGGRRQSQAAPGQPGIYSLDVLSVIESTLDDPRQILSAQQFRARGEAVAAMKAEGIEYDDADGAARGRHLAQAAGGAAGRRLRDLPRGASLGGRLRAVTRSPSCATCTSGR